MKKTMSDVAKLKEGRGSGEKDLYKPWIRAHEVTGQGINNRPLGWKTGREHQLLSNLEYSVFLAFEWDDNILDIREQFPLDQIKTINIANKLGVKHPSVNDEPIVMTTDFLLTVQEPKKRFYARTVKESKELQDERKLEKLEIEKIYFQEEGIDWGIITEKEMSMNFTNNMIFLHNHKAVDRLGDIDVVDTMIKICSDYLRRFPDNPLIQSLNAIDNQLNSEAGTALSLIKFMLANKIVKMDMFKERDFRSPANETLEWSENQ
jgi:hypothetical protein